MTMTDTLRARRAHMGQAGFSTISGLAAIAGALSLAGLMAMSGTEQVEAAETTVCQLDKRVIMTAVESFYLTAGDLDYPEPLGDDGLEEVRAAGYLRTESKYWRYAGVDPTGAPEYVIRSAITGCT